ncbi:MAG: hypothetical protein AVDCRST_MAG43-857, partial [uncultured Thermomicrobiales bacterium]
GFLRPSSRGSDGPHPLHPCGMAFEATEGSAGDGPHRIVATRCPRHRLCSRSSERIWCLLPKNPIPSDALRATRLPRFISALWM